MRFGWSRLGKDEASNSPAVAWGAQERRNTAVMVAGEALWGLYGAIIAASTVLTVLLRDLGGGNSVGLISAIQGGALLLPQVFGAVLFYGKRPVKRILISWQVLATVPFLLAMAAAIHWSDGLPPLLVRTILLVCFGCTQALIAVVIPSWTDWMAHLCKIHHRGTVMSLLMAGSALVSIGGACAAGFLIELDSSPSAYARHYLLAAAFALLSMMVFACVRDESHEGTMDETPINRGWGHCRVLLERFDASVRDHNTQAFMVGRALTVCGFSVLPFITLYYTSASGGNLSDSFVVSCGAALSLAAATSQLMLGRIGDRRGHRTGLIFGASMQVVTLMVVLSTSGPASCLLAYFCAGVAVGSTSLANFNLLLETCPHDSRVAHITVNNIVLGLSSVVAPLLSAWMAEQWGLRPLFLVCLILSVSSVIWLIIRLREPRHMMTFSSEKVESFNANA